MAILNGPIVVETVNGLVDVGKRAVNTGFWGRPHDLFMGK